MARTAAVAVAIAAVIGAGSFGSTAFANSTSNRGHNTGNGVPSPTTLDACGYFVGTQTPAESYEYTTSDGLTHHSDRGTWTGVSNNYGYGPVASLGSVQGAYNEDYSFDTAGNLSGTEEFNSNAGSIDQTYSYASSTGTWSVAVTATRELSFLTSNTNGACYQGPFPRP